MSNNNPERDFGTSVTAMLASLLSNAAALGHYVAPHRHHRRGVAGAKLRRHAAERRVGLSPRGY